MMVLKAVLLASLIFSSLAMGDDPVTPECELNNQPLTENPLAGIAPSCLVQRPMSTTPQEYFQNDQRVCDCIDRSPLTSLITPRSTTSDTTEVEEGDVFVNEEIIASEIPPSRVNDQCITFMEFSSHREMPRENEFFTTIPTGTFNPSDWRAEDLIRQYDTAPANARPGIEERLRFLHRNSQIEALMSAETGPAFPDAREKQIELFNLLKTLSPPSGSNCSSTPHGCLEEMQRSGAYNNFRQSLANLMNDPVLANKIEDASDARILRLVRQDERNVERGQFPLNTVEDLYAFMNIASPELIGNCAGPEADAECYENFPVYCRGLRTVATNIERNQSLPGVSVDNRILIENNMNTWTEGFERFNTQICNTPHQNSAGQSLTFFQYKNQQCPANQSTTPLCSDRQQLVSQYLAAFPGPDDSEAYNRFSFGFYLHKDPVSVAAEASLFLGNRSVMAKESSQRFSQQLNSPTIPKATMQGLITAAKVSSSTTSRSSTTSSASLSPGINAPLNPIGSTSGASGSANSRFQNNRNDNPFPNSNSDTFRSSALRDLTRPIDYNEFSDEPAPFPLRRPEERRVNNNQIADGNSQQTPIPQRPELSQPQFSGGQTQTAPSSGPGNRRAISGGGGGSGVSSSAPDAPQVSSSGGRRSIIEVSPRRGSGSRS